MKNFSKYMESKFDIPQSIKYLFKFCPKNEKLRLIVHH